MVGHVVISENVSALVVAGVIGILGCAGLFSVTDPPDLVVLFDIESNALMTENVSGNLSNFRRRNYLECVSDYKCVITYGS